MTGVLAHRGPDDEGVWGQDGASLGNRRLAIIDLSPLGHQPMTSDDGRYVLSYNGEVYNYLELRRRLAGPFKSETDTEVVLRSLQELGPSSLRDFNGMFSLALWDRRDRVLLLARDRLGVKPLYFTMRGDAIYFASEIKALAAGGIPLLPDEETWATYLRYGLYEHNDRSFYKGIRRLRPGHLLRWREGEIEIRQWDDLEQRIAEARQGEVDEDEALARYEALLVDAVSLRFRSDVPVGVTLSGGLDSSVLVGSLRRLFGEDVAVRAFHYATGDPQYDETPWVRMLLEGTRQPLHVALLRDADVPAMAQETMYHQEEPFGGIPTLAHVNMYRLAREQDVTVLLGGEGMDEQWAGYDYYRSAANGPSDAIPKIQGTRSSPTRPRCLAADFGDMARVDDFPAPFDDALANLRYRDLRYTKIPRALRFGDRSSSQSSCELREPFLDHRLVALAIAQPADRLIRNGEHKYLLRRLARSLLPSALAEAPKRPLQTPQREWLSGPLRNWVDECLDHPAVKESGWFNMHALLQEWKEFKQRRPDNSFYVWQWISVALASETLTRMRSLPRQSTSVS